MYFNILCAYVVIFRQSKGGKRLKPERFDIGLNPLRLHHGYLLRLGIGVYFTIARFDPRGVHAN